MRDLRDDLDRMQAMPEARGDWDAVLRDANVWRRSTLVRAIAAFAAAASALFALALLQPWEGEGPTVLERALAAVDDGPVFHAVLRGSGAARSSTSRPAAGGRCTARTRSGTTRIGTSCTRSLDLAGSWSTSLSTSRRSRRRTSSRSLRSTGKRSNRTRRVSQARGWWTVSRSTGSPSGAGWTWTSPTGSCTSGRNRSRCRARRTSRSHSGRPVTASRGH
jgi:hypothetical protein